MIEKKRGFFFRLFTLFRMFLYFVQSQSLLDFIAILRSRFLNLIVFRIIESNQGLSFRRIVMFFSETNSRTHETN